MIAREEETMMKRFSVALIIVLCCSSLATTASQSRDRPAGPYLSALTLIGRGQYEEALAALRAIIREDSGSSRAAQKILEVSGYLKATGRAKDIFEQLLREKAGNAAALYGLGLYFSGDKDFVRALEYFNKAIALDSRSPHFFQAFINASEGLKQLDVAESVLARLAGKEPGNLAPLYGLAFLRYRQGKRDEAMDVLDKAIRLDPNEPMPYRLKCDVLEGNGQNKEMLALALDKVKLCVERDPDLQIDFYIRIGKAQSVLGNYPASLEYDRKALDLAREIGNKKSEGIALGNVGVYYANTGNIPEATKLFLEKLAVMKELDDQAQQVGTLSNLGALNDWQGNVPEALKRYGEALRILEKLDDPPQKALIMGNMGAAFEKLSDYPKALDHYHQALKIFEDLKDKGDTAWMLGNIGVIATKLGNDAEALGYFEKALAILQEVGNKKYEGWALGMIGVIYKGLGQPEKSIQFLERALAIAREIGDKRLEFDHLANLGSHYREAGEYVKSAEALGQALKIAEQIGNKVSIAEAHLMLGILFRDRKDYDRSIAEYEGALELGREIGVPRTIWNSEWGLAVSYQKKGEVGEAVRHYRSALESVESVRGKLTTQEQKSGFLGETINIYEGLINLLFRLRDQEPSPEYVAESYHLAERAKARAFLELLAETKVDLASAISGELEGQEKEHEGRLTAIQDKLLDPRLDTRGREVLYKELQGVESQYLEFIRELRQKLPGYAALVYPEPCSLSEIQSRVLDGKTYLVEFFLGEDNAFLWVVSKDKVLRGLSFPREHEVFKRIRDYQTQIAQRKINFDFRLGKEIFDVLMKEALRDVPASARLIIVPDGPLLRFPFEALVTDIQGGAPKYLLEDYTISYAPSASVLAELMDRKRSEPAAQVDLLALGNPIIDVEGSTDRQLLEQLRGGARLEPLPFAEDEVSSIGRLYQQNGKSAELYVRDKALEDVVKSDANGKFKILHFATHGFVDDRIPALSGLLLASSGGPDGEDGYLRLNEIFHLRLNADLAVLSACETALGKEVKGEGMVGLTRAFFYAGARSVIASLWMVNDQSTSLLMEDLHAQYIKGADASTALRRAKLGLLRGRDSRFRHPFFWAPFVLMGASR